MFRMSKTAKEQAARDIRNGVEYPGFWEDREVGKSHSRIAEMVKEDLKREAMEVARLARCEQVQDFEAVMISIIEDLEVLAEKYHRLLQSL